MLKTVRSSVDKMTMAETTAANSPLDQPVVDYRRTLEAAVARPEPMCLVMVRAEIPVGGEAGDELGPLDGQVATEMEARLRRTLRGYDILAPVDATTFMVVIRTLADAANLEYRIGSVFEDLSAPYAIGPSSIQVPITLGAVVREPSESPTQLLQRADEALARAQAGGSALPVLI